MGSDSFNGQRIIGSHLQWRRRWLEQPTANHPQSLFNDGRTPEYSMVRG